MIFHNDNREITEGVSLRAQRGRSHPDCAQTAARPRALDDGLWLRASNFGGHTQDQRHRPCPYAVASYPYRQIPLERPETPARLDRIYGHCFSHAFLLKQSRTATGGAATSRGLGRSNKRANKPALYLTYKRIHIEAAPRQETACVFDAVDSRRLDTDVFKTGSGKLRHVLVVTQGSCDTAYPKLHVFLNCIRNKTPDNNVGYGQSDRRV
jgi:hypothetical protein